MSYSDELLDQRWRSKRLQILKRDGFKCTVCGSLDKLTVHHTYYRTGKRPWQYPNDALLTLCDKCHYDFHCTNETPIKGKQKSKHKGKKYKVKKDRYMGIESNKPRYRKRVNNIWIIIESNT